MGLDPLGDGIEERSADGGGGGPIFFDETVQLDRRIINIATVP